MCGLTGYWSRNIEVERGREFLEDGCRILRHRGPDEIGILQREDFGTGFTRLSILDLETGMQPIVDPSDGTLIVCNGQIYNYIELRSELPSVPYRTTGDMEVALNAYRHWGTRFPERLNGMFAGAVHDPDAKRVVLFRDRFGIKPLYYTVNEYGFFFSSEVKPLLRAPGMKRELNRRLLPEFFTYRYLPGDETLFRGVMKVPPGSILVLDTENGGHHLEHYWEWKFREVVPKLTVEEAGEEFHRLFTDAVRIRLRSDVEVGSLISGGIDSSAVASAAAIHKPDLKLFTIGFDEDKYDETGDVDRFLELMPGRFRRAEVVRDTCRPGRLDLLPGIIAAVEEPISLGTMVPTDQVCRLASERLKVVLTGEGADEIFAGYRKFLVEAAAMAHAGASDTERKRLLALYPEIAARTSGTGDDHITRHIAGERLFTEDELLRLTGSCPGREPSSLDRRLRSIPDSMDPISAMQVVESLTRLPSYVNLRLDKLSMRHSLETRTPFLDFRLAEFAATLPLELRIDLAAGKGKYLCRESFREYGLLPAEVTERAKKPFTMPIADWFSNPSSLPEHTADILLGDTVDRQGVLDGDMVRSYACEVTGKGVGPETLISAGDRVFAIVVFTLWYSEFMKETP